MTRRVEAGSDPSSGSSFSSLSLVERLALAATVASIIVVGVAAVLAWPLSVDGGWYSYPAYAWSLGRDPFSNHFSIDAASRLEGFAAVFGFETTSSVRLFYATPWFQIFGVGLPSIRALSFVEYALGGGLGYLMFMRVFRDRSLALLTTALLLTDKTLLLGAATDFRPDIALLAGGCALYLALHGSKGERLRTVTASVLAVLVAGVAVTAVIPIAAVLVARCVQCFESEEHRARTLRQLGIVGTVAVVAFLGRPAFFYWLLDPSTDVGSTVDAGARISAMYQAGPWSLLTKEAFRLGSYFWFSNVPLLLALVLMGVALTVPGSDGRRVPRALIGPLIGLLAGALAMVLLDPHLPAQHMLPLMPFALIAVGKVEATRLPSLRALFAGLVLLSGLSGVAVGTRQIFEAARTGEGNAFREAILADLVVLDRPYLALGPTELWPFFPPDRDVLMVDFTRHAGEVANAGVEWAEVDYVVLNRDYDIPAWIQALEVATASQVCVLLDRRPELVVLAPRPCLI